VLVGLDFVLEILFLLVLVRGEDVRVLGRRHLFVQSRVVVFEVYFLNLGNFPLLFACWLLSALVFQSQFIAGTQALLGVISQRRSFEFASLCQVLLVVLFAIGQLLFLRVSYTVNYIQVNVFLICKLCLNFQRVF
jgi:hypothetical protein